MDCYIIGQGLFDPKPVVTHSIERFLYSGDISQDHSVDNRAGLYGFSSYSMEGTVNIRNGHQEKSRLGRLLVNRGYLTEIQLEQGLKLQRETGQRLGEVFVAQGLITEKELQRVLRHQSRYRNAAALVTMVTLPFQPLVSLASTQSNSSQESQRAGEMYDASGLSPLTDDELSSATGQSTEDFLARVDTIRSMAEAARDSDGSPLSEELTDAVEGLKFVVSSFVPVLNFLKSDLTISGVHYRDGEPRYQVSDAGVLQLALPERIESIEMNNIRVSEAGGASLGNVTLTDIQFQAGSNMRIYSR